MALNLEAMHTQRAKAARIEDGTYPARFSAIIDLGIQAQTDWQTGEATDPKPRVLITWTLPTETMEREHEDGTVEVIQRMISKEYTLSNHEKSNIVALVKSMGTPMSDLTALLNLPCMVEVGSTMNNNAKVVNCVKTPKTMPVDELTNPPTYFDFDNPDKDLFLSLPAWAQDKIKDAENYSGFADGWTKEAAAA